MAKKKSEPTAVKALIDKNTVGKHRRENQMTPLDNRGVPTDSRLRVPQWLGGK